VAAASGTGNIQTTVTLLPGGTVTFTAVAQISSSATGTLTNTATVAVPPGDTTPADNSASDSDSLTPQADLAIAKTDNVTSVVPGTSTTYTIVVSNAGPNTAVAQTVTDNFPATITSVSWTAVPSAGSSVAATSGTGNIATTVTLLPGGSVTFTAVAHISASATGTLTNTATVAVPPGDNTPADNSATDTDTLTPQADLAITKTDKVTSVVPGTSTTYTIVVSNAGPSTAVAQAVTDNFPSAITAVSWTAVPSAGSSVAASSGTDNIATTVTLLPGGSVTFTAVAQISASATGTLTNMATVAVPPGDNTPADNSATDTDTLTPQAADLSIVKTASPTQAIMGQNLTFTLTVHNNGPNAATDVIVSDPLPPGLFFIGVGSISQGSVNVTGDVWTVGTLAAGATANVQIITQVIAIGPVVNMASVRADQFDSDRSNNQSSAQITGLVPPPLISKRLLLVIQDNPLAFDGTNQRFIAHLYSDLLHRESDVDGLASWSLLMALGGTRTQVVVGFENSPEYRADQVEGIYERFLHRSAGPAEVGAWLNLLNNGTTVEQMEAVVLGSLEYYQRRAGSSTTGFLDALYGDALGRAIDPIGLAGWSQALANGSTRASVGAAVLLSAEGDQHWIESVYQQYLHRPADPSGLSFWGNELAQGAGEEQVLALILASDEYLNRS
jgi:uncharacterized repeat protein (TIGR01451 family)